MNLTNKRVIQIKDDTHITPNRSLPTLFQVRQNRLSFRAIESFPFECALVQMSQHLITKN